MSDTTMEKKLALIQQVRSSHDRNQFDLTNRERILYGKTSSRSYLQNGFYDTPYKNTDIYEDTGMVFLKLRFMIAAVLLAAIILLDLKGGSFAGITTKELFDAISRDYTTEIDHLFSDTQTGDTLN
ncbi:MAG: hypothetical protein NC094_00235 [Bacteroidales bacterium]|nr:hypothetical protein [Lachnoclostridium sp.]MCM1384641.1 hypothetical protein [Lachnoclostridium sp.]MCM1463820.1 hypothetical protein [Bacteroidales bacterium]